MGVMVNRTARRCRRNSGVVIVRSGGASVQHLVPHLARDRHSGDVSREGDDGGLVLTAFCRGEQLAAMAVGWQLLCEAESPHATPCAAS